MANNSTVYWDIQTPDGTGWFSLHTYAWSVKSFGGRRWVAGAKRGENIMLPHRQGRIYVPKFRESQTYDLNMWVLPTEDDGRRSTDKTIEQMTHENWRKLIRAFDQEGQFRIRKRWHLDSSNRDDFYTGASVESAIALAEFVDATGPDSDDGKGFYGNITLALADPYFYGNQILGSYTAASKVANSIVIPEGESTHYFDGESPTSHIWLTFQNCNGSDTRVVFPDGNWVELLTSRMSDPNDRYIIDFQSGIAVRSLPQDYLEGYPSTDQYVDGLVRRNPYFAHWPTINPNKYPISTITRNGEGTIGLIYDPAYR